MDSDKVINSVRRWVETVVIGLNLCPFARRELANNRVRFSVSKAVAEEQLLVDLRAELSILVEVEDIETILLIHPGVLQGFFDFNQFLTDAEMLLVEMGVEGVFQIASFHPDYQFGGSDPDDVENYTNRSPFPMLHLIREESLERAIAGYPDADEIPDRNMELMRSLGHSHMRALLLACYHEK